MCGGLQELFSKEALIPFDSRHPSCQDSEGPWEADFNYRRKTGVRQREELLSSPEQQLFSTDLLQCDIADSTEMPINDSALWRCEKGIHWMEIGWLGFYLTPPIF